MVQRAILNQNNFSPQNVIRKTFKNSIVWLYSKTIVLSCLRKSKHYLKGKYPKKYLGESLRCKNIQQKFDCSIIRKQYFFLKNQNIKGKFPNSIRENPFIGVLWLAMYSIVSNMIRCFKTFALDDYGRISLSFSIQYIVRERKW